MAPPPALDSAAYAAAFEEVRQSGAKAAGARRSAEQTQYAAYWYEIVVNHDPENAEAKQRLQQLGK